MMTTMLRRIVPCLLLALLPTMAAALDITSIQPSTATPGSLLTLTGGPFGPGTRLVIGNYSLPPEALHPASMTVRVPAELVPGDYVLFLTDGKESSQQAFILHLVEPQPTIRELAPESLDACRPQGQAGEVMIRGQGFAAGARVLLDGATIRAERTGKNRLSASLPPLDPGNHRLQVVNPGGSASLPHNLTIRNQPVIEGIDVGEDSVNFYQLVITGRNFLPRSTLLVDGTAIRSAALQAPGNRDRVEFVDCTTLIYTRHQVSGQLQRTRFRILNPGGAQSETYEATIR